ncbi:DUF2442 domain-containing protein [Paraburkholderia caribensis]|uniref:DUF2442 domain-containing protein n=1 Tax=Paraburkholderia caribensis TaxID=75105 RepID=UPI00071F71B4|nr:DUF2442 domain-containing protein [Paraburkholderia caribensis]ALP62847.1 hypothetical protein AN416_09720 [Paraburkholderia caribensis]AUT51922.1 DUF2442 domain-containing protein [Paraburkholderia caribensis]
MKYFAALDDEPTDLDEDVEERNDLFLFGRGYRAKINLVKGYRLHWAPLGTWAQKIADGVTYIPEGRAIMIHFEDGTSRTVSVDEIHELADVPDEDLSGIVLTFAGTGLSLLDHDVDISIAGLLRELDGSDGSGSAGSKTGSKGLWKYN